MIQIKYRPLFDIEMVHPFYESGQCPDFLLSPTNDCRENLNKFGLRFLPTPFGGRIYARVKTVDSNERIKTSINDGVNFSFSMLLKRNEFENYTTLNTVKPRNSHYYFNNLTENLSEDSLPLLVANTTSKVVSDADLLPFVRNTFSYAHTADADVLGSEWRFVDAGQTFHQELNNYNQTFNFSYDLKPMPTGRAVFLIDDTEIESFYVQDPLDPAHVFGVVEIFHKDDLPTSYQFLKPDDSIGTVHYKIPFAARATRWRYIVHRKFNLAVSEVSVGKTNGDPIAFTAVPNPPDGQFILASDQPVQLKEEPILGIQLRDQTNNILIPHLPNPSLNFIKIEGGSMFSDILLTI